MESLFTRGCSLRIESPFVNLEKEELEFPLSELQKSGRSGTLFIFIIVKRRDSEEETKAF